MKIAVVHELGEGGSNDRVPVEVPDTVQPEVFHLVSQALASKGHTTTVIAADDGIESVMLQLRAFSPDVVFNLVEGARGRVREALYPSLFGDLRIPYTGSDAYSLTVCVDKYLSKTVARENGVPVPQGVAVTAAGLPGMQWGGLRLPAIVKPTYEDHSRGIRLSSICRTISEVQERVRSMLLEFDSVLVEEYLLGTDVVVPFLEGVGDGLLPVCETVFSDDSPIKHLDLILTGGTEVAMRCPARLPENVTNLLRVYAKRLVRVLGLKDAVLLDFRVTPDGIPFLLEVNGVPSMQPRSPLFLAAEQRGLSMADCLSRMCDSAVKRHRKLFGPAPHGIKDRKVMRVGFVFNLKRNAPTLEGDQEAEWDPPKTINAIKDAIERQGHVVIPLEANETLPQRLSDAHVDVVFNIAEGFRGRTREAQVPALCDMLGVPHTGSDATTLAVSMDKGMTKDLFLRNDVPTPMSQLFWTSKERLDKRMIFPLIVKPNAEGSSKGIRASSVVYGEDELRRVVKEAVTKYGAPILVEQYITGREFTVALLAGDSGMRVLSPLEVVFLDASIAHPVYSFDIKQDWDKNVRYDCPAVIDKKLEKALQTVARRAFKALGCRDFARVDFRVGPDGTCYVLEVNPLPGLTPNFSDMCLIANACGITYDDLIASILKPAIRRGRVRQPRPRPLAAIQKQEGSGAEGTEPLVQPAQDQGELHLLTPG